MNKVFMCFELIGVGTVMLGALKLILVSAVWLKLKLTHQTLEYSGNKLHVVPAAPKEPPMAPIKLTKDPETRKQERQGGLQRAFQRGEVLPWKRIMFAVESVGYDQITLKAVDTTSGFKKQAARHAE
jgi:hypothetical protein